MNKKLPFNRRCIWMILVTLLVTVVPENLNAQQIDYEWSWSTRGGGSRHLSGGNQYIGDYQKVHNIAVDNHNNYYFITQVGSGTSPGTDPTFGNIPNDTINITTYNEPNANRRDTYLVSTTCDGEFRWHKSIGGTGDIYAEGIGTDNEGGVYVAGNLRQFLGNNAVPVHYDQDSIKSAISLDKKIYLIKYDTLGNFQWLREPQPATSTPYFASSGEIYVEPDGTVHWMVALDPNAELDNGSIVAQDNYFPPTGTQVGDLGILRYDKNGNLLSYTRLNMDMHGHINFSLDYQIRFTYDPIYNQYYMVARAWTTFGTVPYHPAIIDGQEVTGVFYLAAFDATTDNSVWWHEHEGMYSHWPRLRDVKVDDTGDVYVTGAMIGGDSLTDYNEFAGYVFDKGNAEPFCMKLDNNGQVIWVSYPDGAARAGESITVNKDGVFLGQGYSTFGGGSHSWDSVNFTRPSGHGADSAVIRLDKNTGEAVAIYDIMGEGYGFNDEITAITTDKLGNIVVGGYMQGVSLFVNHPVVPQMYKRGVNPTDFFIAKLGKDGVSCDDEWMNLTEVSLPTIKLWPNPTKGELFLENKGSMDNVEVYDIMGRVSIPGNSIDKQTSPIMLDMSSLKAGIYFVRVYSNSHQQTFKVIKK